jgi:carboxypeptidase T
MKKIFSLLLVCAMISVQSIAQQNWSRVKVYGSQIQLQQLGDLGLPIDHGEYKKDAYLISDLSESDIVLLEENGFTFEILIQDVKAYYVERNSIDLDSKGHITCSTTTSGFDPVTPTNFQLGTMGGFYKYQEFLDEIDSMRSKYPNLISAKSPIDTYTTIDGNPIYWMRISDNPDVNEAEEEVLYSALHHAREPASLTQLIYYMWYVLENYGTDAEITYLVDNTEMYFIPMLNPDGYRYNELTDPNGGGMHRKNRRNVGTSNKGVDLNRNYPYHWNESGTSGSPNGDTWAGTGAFSEVETQAMKWFVEQHAFKFAFNAHTSGNLLLYPVGWSNVEFAPHANYFDAYTDNMVKYNGYANSKSSDLYPAAGDSDDWMYIDDIGVNGKDTIFAMTPEVSSEGGPNDFWPPSSAIESICKATVYMNKMLPHMPLVFGVTTDLVNSKVENLTGYFNYDLERLGLTDGDFTVSMTAIAGIQSLGTSNTHTLNIMEIVEDSIQFTLNSGIQFGDDIIYVLETDNGTWINRDTVYKTYGSGTQVFADDGSTTANWSGTWSFTNEASVSPNNSITDSPFVDYQNNVNSDIELTQSFDFTNATYAYVNFWAKWEIEDNWDYVQFQVSTNGGGSWTPLCGKYTNMGGSNQDVNHPLYDGFQTEWVLEEMDLTVYIGQTDVRFKFTLISDGGVKEDGFYFDDFAIYTDASPSVGAGIEDLKGQNIRLYPNPTNDLLNISLNNAEVLDRIEITNELGQVISTIVPTSTLTTIGTAQLAEGIYFIVIYNKNNETITERFSVIR